MDTDKAEIMQVALTEQIIGAFYATYNELGTGFLEAVYENALTIALQASGLVVRQQAPVSVRFRGHTVGEYRADVLVQDAVIVEIKAVASLMPAHEAQLLNYLKATGKRVGLLLNFGPRPQVKRRVL